ncbi:citrate synthase [Aspergillus terreus]|uniref:Citrate synthase n=1 Tax=Aspergillus terreus TaxID=33178 RepID=A0A5M3Z074_ASPTE|nr:hypothetical protein ATETN484_0007009100 [Aspergillus terreus]GFF15896.1 citrate synthase [Aspergillus terreus]
MSSGTLYIRDSRTNTQYQIPVKRNAVRATDLKRIKASPIGTDPADQVANGLRVHDPGLQNTTVMENDIIFSGHAESRVLFRGYSPQQLWNSDFEDMLHLLVWRSYPTEAEKKELSRRLANSMIAVPDSVKHAIQVFPRTTPSLPMVLAGLSTYLGSLPDSIPASTRADLYPSSSENIDNAIIRTIAGYAVVFGLVSSHRTGVRFIPPSPDMSYCENLLTMAGLVDASTGRPDPVTLTCFRRFGMGNSDHGLAASTFSALVTGSSLADPISCMIAAVTSAYGPLHFAATETVQRTLRDIGTVENVPTFIDKIKRSKSKLFGFGHRMYKGIDPRVRMIHSIVKDLTPASDQLMIAERLEELTSRDEYFQKKGLYPNGDLYGNLVFTGLGFEPETIPAAMLTQRIAGIMAHWREYICECALGV